MTFKSRTDYHARHWEAKQTIDEYTDVFDQFHPKTESISLTDQSLGTVDQATGGDNPLYKQYISQGADCGNSYVAQRTFYVDGNWKGSMKYKYTPYPPSNSPPIISEFTVRGQTDFGVPGPANIDSSVYNTALSSFIPKANQRITQFSTGTFVGELRETIHMFKHPLQGIRGLLGDYLGDLGRKRGRAPKSPGRRRKYVADTWLEYSFGLKPFISDIVSASEAVSRLANGFVPAEKVSVTRSAETVVYESPYGQGTNGFLAWHQSALIKDRTKVRVYGAVKLENSGGSYPAVVGLRTDLFIPTLWELVPYSWLVDYFTNVGQIVEAACFNTSRLSYWGATIVGEREQITRCHGDATNPETSGYISSSFSGGNQTMTTKSFTRIPRPYLLPSLAFHVPNKFSKWANMAAVAVQHRRLQPY